jgi:hypothetical protein
MILLEEGRGRSNYRKEGIHARTDTRCFIASFEDGERGQEQGAPGM